MTKLGTRTLAALGTLLGIAACNEIAGIHEPKLRGEGAAPCGAAADCEVEEPECRTATCKDGACVFDDVPAGTALSEQKAGDCIQRVCDGAGKIRLDPLATDVPDDDNPCTLDTCEGTVPKHTIQAEVPCYKGPPATRGVGDCKEGVQKCDAQGNPVGDCDGQVLPGIETCLKAGDEDCDGKANEEGEGCVCVPGEVRDCYTGPPGTEGVGICHGGKCECNDSGALCWPCEGEETPKAEVCDASKLDEDCDGQINEDFLTCTCGDSVVDPGTEDCDDGNMDDTDGCTNACKLPACGDGITQPGHNEACDGEPDCLSTCVWTTVEAVVAAGSHTCALFGNGRLKCWGYNANGQLGLGDVAHRGDAPGEMGAALPAVSLGTGKLAAGAGAGAWQVCAWMTDGSLKCWGYNKDGQLGLGNTNNRGDNPGEMGNALPSVSLGAGVTVTAVSAGLSHACALLSQGEVKCWGYNLLGQLGLGDGNNRGDGPGEMGSNLPFVDLGTGKTARAVSAGGTHTCALLKGALESGPIKCWGESTYGQLGLGDKNTRGNEAGEMGNNLPEVSLGNISKAVSAGTTHTCALLNDDTVKCWGNNSYGQLGLGDTLDRGDGPGEMGTSLPVVNLGAGKKAKAVSAGMSHTCALLTDGTVKCWGYNAHGQLGLGDKDSRGDGPGEMGDALPAVDLGAGKTAKAISAGASHTCALLTDGTIKCWGYNGSGQLGLGDKNNRGDGPGEMGDALPAVQLFY